MNTIAFITILVTALVLSLILVMGTMLVFRKNRETAAGRKPTFKLESIKNEEFRKRADMDSSYVDNVYSNYNERTASEKQAKRNQAG